MTFTYRLPPTPSYDIEATESWLSAMAKEGLYLSEEGFIDLLLRFDKKQPSGSVRYRLEASKEPTGILSESGGEPDREAVELAKDAGWQYLRKYGQFHIYMTADRNAPELNTDPEVQAIALEAVRKREKSSGFTTFFWAIVYPAFFLFGYPVATAVAAGPAFILCSLVLVALMLYGSIRRLTHLRRLHKRLANGEPLDHNKDYQFRARRHQIFTLLDLGVMICWLCLFLGMVGDSIMDEKTLLKDYDRPLPCMTMADLGEAGSFVEDDMGSMFPNAIQSRPNWFAPAAVSIEQHGSFALADGREISGGIDIEYFETRYHWMAKELAREMVWKEKYGDLFNSDYKEIDIPSAEELDVDYAVGFHSIGTHFPAVIMAKDNQTIKVCFYQYGESEGMAVEEWVRKTAETLQE